jgi:hypothetical protein
VSDQGFRLQSGNNDYRIRFGGLVQMNGRFFTSGNDKNLSSTFYMTKVSQIISGALVKYWEFQIMPDFGQGKVVLQDAWIHAGYFTEGQFQLASTSRPWIWNDCSPIRRWNLSSVQRSKLRSQWRYRGTAPGHAVRLAALRCAGTYERCAQRYSDS